MVVSRQSMATPTMMDQTASATEKKTIGMIRLNLDVIPRMIEITADGAETPMSDHPNHLG